MDVGRELSALRLTSSLSTGRPVSHEVNLSQLRVDLTQSLGHISSPNVRLADRGELLSLCSSLIDSVLSPQRTPPVSGRPASKLNTSMDATHDSPNRLKRTSAVGGSRPTSAISVLQDTGDLPMIRLHNLDVQELGQTSHALEAEEHKTEPVLAVFGGLRPAKAERKAAQGAGCKEKFVSDV